MITAADRSTKQAKELIAVPSGALLMTPEECEACFVNETTMIQTGPCRLVGVILNVGTEVATITIESDTQIVLKVKMTSGSRPVFPALPIACKGNLGVTLTGAGAEAIVYYIPM
ncbi:MAG: hypothetical protein K6T99_04290 [Armatimonadetes bacterium]|nr:hypothetical protein [Armatimonadota bacterium]